MNARSLAIASLAGAALVVAYEFTWLGDSRLAPVLMALGLSLALLVLAFLTSLQHPGDRLAKILDAAHDVDWDVVGGPEKGEAVIHLKGATLVLVDPETGCQTEIWPGAIRFGARHRSSGRESMAYLGASPYIEWTVGDRCQPEIRMEGYLSESEEGLHTNVAIARGRVLDDLEVLADMGALTRLRAFLEEQEERDGEITWPRTQA